MAEILPSGATPITRLEDEHASSSGVGSTTQWFPIRDRVTRTGAMAISNLLPS